MFEIPEDLLNLFFKAITVIGKYRIEFNGNSAFIKPDENEAYYKPVIIVEDLDKLKKALENYIYALNDFLNINNKYLQKHHDLMYFFNNLFLNMTNSDAQDLASYVNKRAYFFSNKQFENYEEPQFIATLGGANIYVERDLEYLGLETPFVLAFSLEIDGVKYNLPLVRYAFDENNTCYIFAIQFGRMRVFDVQDSDYKNVVNNINKGVKKYRNVSPSFVLVFSLFLELLKENNVNKIVVPDYLFGRYRRYFKNVREAKSDGVLTRILDNFLILLKRMEYQFEEFEIDYYPNEIDSYTHINLNYENKLDTELKLEKKF